MAFFNNPWTNHHEMNEDWIIAKMQQWSKEFTNLIQTVKESADKAEKAANSVEEANALATSAKEESSNAIAQSSDAVKNANAALSYSRQALEEAEDASTTATTMAETAANAADSATSAASSANASEAAAAIAQSQAESAASASVDAAARASAAQTEAAAAQTAAETAQEKASNSEQAAQAAQAAAEAAQAAAEAAGGGGSYNLAIDKAAKCGYTIQSVPVYRILKSLGYHIDIDNDTFTFSGKGVMTNEGGVVNTWRLIDVRIYVETDQLNSYAELQPYTGSGVSWTVSSAGGLSFNITFNVNDTAKEGIYYAMIEFGGRQSN